MTSQAQKYGSPDDLMIFIGGAFMADRGFLALVCHSVEDVAVLVTGPGTREVPFDSQKVHPLHQDLLLQPGKGLKKNENLRKGVPFLK